MSVQTLLIDYQRERILEQTYNSPNIIPIRSKREILRHGIRKTTLLASIDIAMFQPTTENPCWLILKGFTFTFCDVLPSDEWVVSHKRKHCCQQKRKSVNDKRTREWMGDLHYCPRAAR
ncbi:hypothetical protein LB505_001955 [Fusarium chuoi]|nr:hypothetical protein LB505_001955 [Fusarium chuoi]